MNETTTEYAPVCDATTVTRIDPLLELFGDVDSISIVCHDDPDPDCLASALALKRLARREGVEDAQITYAGGISHQQNWSMIEELDLDVRSFDPELLSADLVGFVDHSLPGTNNPVPVDAAVDVVIDHHPVEGVAAQYVDSRPSFGATATMLTEYFRILGIVPSERLATALLFGIRRETLEFVRRSTTLAEYEAAEFLHPLADIDAIQALSESLFTPATLDAIGEVIENRDRRGSCVVSSGGHLEGADAIPLAADYLVNLAGTATTVVFGIVDGDVEVSARTQDPEVHVGRRLRRAFDEYGSAGGHRNMAGATVRVDRLVEDGDGGGSTLPRVNTAVRTLLFAELDDLS